MTKGAIHLGVDSQCLSYLLDAIAGVSEPTDPLTDQRLALIRIWFYLPEAYFLTPTVVDECRSIRDAERKEFHRSFIETLFVDPPTRDHDRVLKRTKELLLIHPKEKDSRIVAEAEEIGIDVLLSYDQRLLRRLGSGTSSVRLHAPADYWSSLGIRPGTRPITVPHHSNPLSSQVWWRW